MEKLYKEILEQIGEDPDREGLKKTPLRAAKALRFLTSGYDGDLETIINGAIFEDDDADEIILVKDIQFHSLCEHHILPFSGKMHVAYIPNNNRIIGLSKIPRIVDLYARRLQVQERLTKQVANTVNEVLTPKGVGVICEDTSHSCMTMRGVQKHGASMATSAMLGVFKTNSDARAELLSMIKG